MGEEDQNSPQHSRKSTMKNPYVQDKKTFSYCKSPRREGGLGIQYVMK